MLRAALAARNPVVVYSDLTAFSLWAGSRDATIRAHADAILEATRGRTLVVPVFNYDFCATGFSDPDNDPSQVGLLSEHFRQRADHVTRMPLFRFAVVGDVPADFPRFCVDPFGASSVFRWLIDHRAAVLAYGCGLRYASACHVPELDQWVPYRYHKRFTGHYIDGEPVSVHYHVRHPEVRYRWDVVDALLAPVFSTHDVGYGKVRVGSADEVYRVINAALSADVHALVEEPTALYRRYGKPLKDMAA